MISLKLPVCTHLGEGSVKVVPEIIRRENAKKVVVFTDQGVRQSGVCDVLLRELADISYAVLDDIPREPSYLDVEKIAGQLEAMACDLIVAIGGGSVFVLSDTMFYERSRKGIWEVLCKGYRLGNEEALAGEHAAHLLLILDEASGISDKAIGVMTGALTEEDNRMLMLSQPTRPSGYFYDSHHSLAKTPGNPKGIWTAIVLNSEESPFVTPQFIRQKLLEYGGRDSIEYMVKVLGQFPREINGYLLGRDECDRAARRKVLLEKNWGWVATADVGNGRDKSVLNICKVSGPKDKRRVVNFKLMEMPGTMDPLAFADFIYNECTPDKYPNITIAVDADGFGSDTCAQLVRRGANPVRIRWGKPMFSNKDKERFVNQRAYANIMARDAIKSGRMRIDSDPKTAEQASKIPFLMNEEGKMAMMRKEHMRQKLNIKSPDRWDTYCFTMLVDYVPANEDVGAEMATFRDDVLAEIEMPELDI